MSKNYLNQMFIYFIVFLIIANSANGQIDSNALGFNPFGSNQEDTSSQEDLMDQSPLINAVSFTNTDITDIFQIIHARTQWSIFPTLEVSKTKINLFAQDITAKSLLDTIVQMTGFIYHKDGDIISVMTYDEYAQNYGLEKIVITLKYGNVDSISTVIKPFLSDLGEAIVYQETNSIVIFESKANLDTIVKVIEQLDIPSDNQTTIKVIDLVYMDVEDLANTLQSIFSEEDNTQNSRNKRSSETIENKSSERLTQSDNNNGSFFTPNSEVGIFPLSSSNKLIVQASKSDMEEIEKLIETLDVFIEPITKTYHFIYIDASEIYTDLENILDIRTGNNSYRGSRGQNGMEGGKPGGLTLVEKTNSILLTGPPSVHRVMDSIVDEVDVTSTYEAGEIRTYKLNNADLEEVAATIRDLLDSKQREEGRTGESKFTLTSNEGGGSEATGGIDFAETEEFTPQIDATVAVNPSTNSIVIRATARQHRELEKLIEKLDERRRQVQIKAMIIEVTTNDDTDFGIELDYINRDTINFTSFGLSTIDPTTGIRDLIVSPGGTSAVLNPGRFQAIVKALQGNDNIRIESSPQILVNDNAEGLIQSIAEQPTRQTNQGENTTTTSFGEYVSAGTQFAVTPHISEFNYLRVQYEIVLNSFGEQAASDLPPARSTSNITSEATVPDGYTIVVGGIQSTKDSESVDKIPLLGDVPVFGALFRNTVTRKQQITTYLFITTTIIESEDFQDIREISDKILSEMGKETNIPSDPNEDDAI